MAPVWWRVRRWDRRYPRCPRPVPPTPLSFAAGSWTSSGPVALPRASRRSSRSPRSRSGPGPAKKIRAFHAASRGTYGARHIHADLEAEGVFVGRKRVARLMRLAGLEGVSPRKWTTTTSRSDEHAAAPDLVNRDFSANAPNKLWVAGITYVPTWEGFLYLAVVLDVWSRKIVGWAMSTSLATELVLAALEMAVRQRQP